MQKGEPHHKTRPSKRAVELAPDYADYWSSLCTSLRILGRHEEALIAAQKAVELEQGNALYHYQLGLAYSELNRHEDSLLG